jgi:RNA polymerase sigma-70 factor (ECF subfamily)
MALADIPLALVEACREGDRSAVERLLKQVSPDIYRIVYSMLRDHDDADEVAQETLVRMFRYIANLKEPEKFAAWAMRITVNQVQTWRMKKGRARLYELDEALEPDDNVQVVGANPNVGNPRDHAHRKEVRAEIEQAMAALPDRQQTAVVLFEIEGCSIKEIATAMSCSEGAVKFNIHEARKKLQRRLAHLVKGFIRRPQEDSDSERKAV